MAGSEAIGPCALYYEQFEIGAHWRSPSRTLTETDALMFAALSGDMASLCFDATVPANIGGRRISGACALALATGLEVTGAQRRNWYRLSRCDPGLPPAALCDGHCPR